MGAGKEEIREAVLELIKTDEEFRLMLAGALGYHEVMSELRKLREDFNRMYAEFNRRLSRVELELGALSESFYCRALLDDLREEIRDRGEKVVARRRNYRIDESDIDLLIETDKSVYVAEVKVKPKHEDVGALLAKADLVRRYYPSKEVVPILAGAMIGREVEEYARSKGVKVYSY